MKIYLTLVMLLLSSFSFAQSADSTTTPQTKLVLVRPSIRTARTSNVKVNINDTMSFWMINNSYMSMDVQPGTYAIKHKKKRKGAEKVLIAAGQTVYVEMHPLVNSWKFLKVDSTQSRYSLNHPQIHNMRKPYQRPLRHIGFSMSPGWGIDNFSVGTTSDGEDISFSYGGGFGLDLSYGSELSKYFEWMLSVGWYESNLTPHVKDASMSFSRFNISATGFYLIPIQGGYTKRLKLGGGPDVMFNNTLKVNLPSVGGSKALKTTWDYKEAVGFHGTFLYQVNMGKQMSFDMGLRYNFAAYTFDKSHTNVYPVSEKIAKPNGQGIFLLLGFNVHF